MPVVPSPPKPSATPSFGGGDSAADAFARAARDRAETTVALDATNRLQGLKSDLSNPDTGYRSLLGGDAVKGIDGQALTGHYLSVFDQGWKDISSKLTPGPQAMFDAAALNMRDDFAKDLVKHEAEQGRVWRQQVLDTTVGNATGALIAGTDGNDAGYTAKARAALVANGEGQGLSGEDLDKQTNLLFGRRVVEPVVTARLSQGDVAGAKAFFDIHRDSMAGDDADILDQRLTEAKSFADTRIAVDGVWNRLGPKSFNDPIDLNAIEDGLVVYHGGDEEARMRARDEVLHRISGFTQARDDTHAGYVNFLIDQVRGGASPSQIAALPQFLALSKDRQQQLSDWHREQLADKLTGFAPDQNLDRMARQFAAYHDLSGDDALKQMSVPQVQALEPVLGEDLTRQALAKKQAADTGQPSRLDDITFRAIAAGLGIDPNPSPFDVEGKARLGVLRSKAEAAIAAAEAGGKMLTPDERRQVAVNEGAVLIHGHPFFDLPKDVQDVLRATLPKPPSIRKSQSVGSLNSNRTSHPNATNVKPAALERISPRPVAQPESFLKTVADDYHKISGAISGLFSGFGHHDAPVPVRRSAAPANLATHLGDLAMYQETNYGSDNWAGASGKISSGYFYKKAIKGYVEDPGGVSYGAYQMASNRNTPQNFVTSPEGARWTNQFAGQDPTIKNSNKSLPPDSPFAHIWSKNASDPEFYNAQLKYIKRTDYDPTVKNVLAKTGVDINTLPLGVQQAVFSAAVQHGPGSIKRKNGASWLIINAINKVGTNVSDPDYAVSLLNTIYADRNARYPGFTARYKTEKSMALEVLKNGR